MCGLRKSSSQIDLCCWKRQLKENEDKPNDKKVNYSIHGLINNPRRLD